MTDQGSPIQMKELLQLTTLGIDEGRIADYTLRMPSDKFIFVHEKGGSPSQFVIIDMANPTHPVRREFNGYYALMNPASKIIALYWDYDWDVIEWYCGVDLFNLETESTMKSHEMSGWFMLLKWINAETLALVTDTEVFHWSTEGESQPRRMFEKHSSLSMIQDYWWDEKLKWFLLFGIFLEDPYHEGMQLFSVERGTSEIVKGQAAAFTQFKMEGNPETSTLLCFASRTSQGAKLHIKELGQPPRGHQPYSEKAVDVYFPPEAEDDIPIEMQTSSKHGIIYLITRCGYVHLYDVETASLIYTSRMSDHDILVTVPHDATSGIIGVNKKGQVLSVSVDEDNFIPYIKKVLKNPDLALRMAVRNNLPGAEDLFLQKFNTLWSQRQYAEAGKFAQNAPELHIKELGQPPIGHQPYTEKAVDVYFPPEAKDDIPISMQTSSKHGIIYLITRSGYVHLYDVETASLIYTSRMSDHDILVTVPHEATSGIIGVNQKGQVLSVSVDEDNLIPYIKNVLKNPDLAFRMAMRNNLPGAEDLFLQKFNTLRSRGQYAEARKLAQNAPQAYSSVLCQTDVQDPAGGISREDPPVQQELPDSSSLSKEAGKFCKPGLPFVPEENKFREDFKELFFSKEDCDVVLKVKGQEFPAHQLILKARSPVFAATFRNPMKEKVTGIVNIEDCDPSSFSDFLYFLYCGDGTCVSEENVFGLFKAADKYDVKELRSKCIIFMKENLSVDNFCDTLVIALQHSEADLLKLIIEFFIKNAPKIVVTVKWQLFLRNYPTQSNELLVKLLVPNNNANN